MGWRHVRIFDTPGEAIEATGVTGVDWVLEPLPGIVRVLMRSTITQESAKDNTIEDGGDAENGAPGKPAAD